MFRSLTIYQLTQATPAVLRRLETALGENPFSECTKLSARSIGFVPPLPNSEEMTYETNGAVLFCLRTDEKSVPSKFVKQEVTGAVAKREAAGEELSKVDLDLIRDKIVADLLPGIPPEPSRTYAYIDKQLHMLFVSASEAVADEFMETLKKALEGVPFKLLGVETDPCITYTQWLKTPKVLGKAFEFGDNCSLKHAQEGGTAIINIQHDDLRTDEMQSMLKAGKQCCRIGLVHEDASFAITAKLGIRKLVLAGERKEEIEEDGADVPTELAVMSRVIRAIMGALEPLLGGYPKQELLDLHDEQGEAA